MDSVGRLSEQWAVFGNAGISTMLESLKPFAGFMTLVLVIILLLLFRPEVRKLVDWLVHFKRIAKTKEGYSLESANQPERSPVLPLNSVQEAAVAAQAVSTASSQPCETESWYDAFVENRYDDAVRLLESEHDQETNFERRVTTRSLIGHLKLRQNPAVGLAYFENLIGEYPTNEQPYYWWALAYRSRNLQEKCLAVIERGLGAVKRKARLLDLKSDCLRDVGRFDEAKGAALQGVNEDPEYESNYSNLATLYLREGDKETARTWYIQALEASEASEALLAEYARFLADNGYTAEAILRYIDLIGRAPKNPTYRALAGNAYLQAGLHSHALRAYKKANELAKEKEGWILANIGNIFTNLGLYAEAIEYFRRALELDVDSQYAHERLAQAQKSDAEANKKLQSLLDEARRSVMKKAVPGQSLAS
jgi:tetratricopeptide (TPR) repeat protein